MSGEQQYVVEYTGTSAFRSAAWDVDVTPTDPIHRTEKPEVATWLVENAPFEYQPHTKNRLEDDGDVVVFESLEDLDGVGPSTAEELRAHGFESVGDLRGLSADELADQATLNHALAEHIVEQLE